MRFAAAVGAALVAGFIATSWTALTLAEFGRFNAVLPLAAFPVAALLCFRVLSRRREGGAAPGILVEDLVSHAAGI